MSFKINSVQETYVAYHKQIERRMDGSSGGVFGAFIETVVREGYYFSGTILDENLRVHHIVTNDPEKISNLCGYQPTESDTTEAFAQIKELLYAGSKVLFCGTSQQCEILLKDNFNYRENLILIDIIHTPFVKQELVDLYASELAKEYGNKVRSIRYYNHEFFDCHAKRILLDNGSTVYTQNSDLFDELEVLGKYLENDKLDNPINQRVGDITIGAYQMDKSKSDGLGYCYISVNTNKGKELFSKTKKRLVIVCTGTDIDTKRILIRPMPIVRQKKVSDIYNLARIVVRGFRAAQWKLRPMFQFLNFNFFNKSIHTNLKKEGVVYIYPNCAFKLVEGFDIELHGPLHIGTRRIASSQQETRLRMESGAKIIVNKSCSFGAGSNVEIYRNAILEVGQLHSNAELTIICGEHISLGTPCNIARNVTVRDTSGHLLALPGYKITKPLSIGNHTWLCTGSTVMPGANIGDGSIVGANSFVTKKIPPFTMTQGNPASEVGIIKYFRM